MSSPGSAMQSFDLPAAHPLWALRTRALVAGGVGLAACVAGAAINLEQFFQSYLIGFTFWFGVGMGSLLILMIHHVAGGSWGAVLRRILESSSRTLPVLLILFLPLLLGLSHVYEWARPEAVAHDPLLQHKAPYLNVPFFVVRSLLYFVVWLLLAWYLNRWSLIQDQTGDPRIVRRLELGSRAGLVAVGFTMTFASIDWVMSLEPHWFSTMYGLLVMGGQLVVAMAFSIQVAARLALDSPLGPVIGKTQFHDLGKFLLAFVMLWAYFAFSQFLIIWSGNLPEETPWYLSRMTGGWEYFGIVVIAVDFALPFALLLSRSLKRTPARLARLALSIMVFRFVDWFWMIAPAFHPGALAVHWMDLAAVVGVGGVWLWAFVGQLGSRALVAVHDPSLPEAA